MFLKKLSIVNYKNIPSKDFLFEANINCFIGNNGVGKTNLLDAIYHLGVGKGYFNSSATQSIRHGEEFYVIDGLFESQMREEQIVCSIKRGQKKIIKCNGKAYERMADHLGKYPMVIISPADQDLILDGSEVRRKFLDNVISQSDAMYLDRLMSYNRTLLQRNTLLKHFAENHFFDADTLSIYDTQLSELGQYIYEKRKAFMKTFLPIFEYQYQYISEGKENVNLTYESSLHQTDLATLLSQNINKDKTLQYTSAGIHKDDLLFEIEGFPMKKYGSQGQQKSFLIALKLSQFEIIKKQLKVIPIFLLDDIFDKLDDNRVAKLVSLVTEKHFGQLFITDTHHERTENVVKRTHLKYKIFPIE
ncbi:DNA replication/repair protein RecF [Capnocytophaga felis]|uniref:DNA replication and repair protein RecF n=1 Tax=Capnocytophaga felis TaxID=2267611 RepID=A0A5M4B994_9FLAO|nr:DNA replication and repair protein RecF [Capnocytophaga felis]GET45842.1 DNA replication and repair protein RecF [Capnocytophaga felis]GET49305.1 DNA replication and repair protein RecF [Capnocytophaga felis]